MKPFIAAPPPLLRVLCVRVYSPNSPTRFSFPRHGARSGAAATRRGASTARANDAERATVFSRARSQLSSGTEKIGNPP